MQVKRKPLSKALLFLIPLGLFFLWKALVWGIKTNLEDQISQYLNTPVAIEEIALSPFSKKITAYQVSIKNPPRFRKKYILVVAETVVRWKNTLPWQPPFDFKEIEAKGLFLNIELTPAGLNLDFFNKRAAKNNLVSNQPEQAAKIDFQIDNLSFKDISLQLDASMAGMRPFTKTLSDVNFKDVGKGGKEAFSFDSVIGKMSENAKADLFKQLPFGDQLKGGGIEGLITNALKNLKGGPKELTPKQKADIQKLEKFLQKRETK